MGEARERLIAWAKGAMRAELDAPQRNDLKMFGPDVRSALVSMGAHEFFLAGQVAACRSSLGLARVLM